MLKYLWCLPVLTLLVGCGLINGESDYIPYTEALESHSHAEQIRITNQTQGIVSILSEATSTSTPTEKALMGAIAMMSIERLQPKQLNIRKPTTGYDVLDHNVSGVVSSALTGVLGYFSYDAIKDLGRNAGTTTFNGAVTADGSFNTSEFHQTGISGTFTGGLSPYETKYHEPTIVKPEVVITGE